MALNKFGLLFGNIIRLLLLIFMLFVCGNWVSNDLVFLVLDRFKEIVL